MKTHEPANIDTDGHAACTCGARSALPLSPTQQSAWHTTHRSATDTRLGLSTKAAAEAIGCSYRQLDYWGRTGLLPPSLVAANGSGSHRRYSTSDIELGRIIAHLAHANALHAARAIAPTLRAVLAQPDPPAGVFITVVDPDIHLTPPDAPAWWLPIGAAA